METGDGARANFAGYLQMCEQLINAGQMLYGQGDGVAERFCQEVTRATQGRAQLLLRRHASTEGEQASSPAPFASFPVQFREHIYGTLGVAATDGAGQATLAGPSLPLQVAHLLAQICGWILYMFELAAFLPAGSQQFDLKAFTSLTRRERDVLRLICRGYDQEAIAEALSIVPDTVKKHRQHIYQQLGVHTEQELLLAAFQAGFFSPLGELF